MRLIAVNAIKGLAEKNLGEIAFITNINASSSEVDHPKLLVVWLDVPTFLNDAYILNDWYSSNGWGMGIKVR